jgi:YD repeat-containing protein
MAAHDNGCEGFNNCEIAGNSSGNFTIAAGTYEFKIRSEYNRTQDVRAEILLNFYDPEVATYTGSVSYIPIGGIRVKQTADYPLNSDPVIKNYDYGDAYPFSVLRLNYITRKYETCCVDSNSNFYPSQPSMIEVTAKGNNLLLHSNSPVYYSSIIERTNRAESVIRERFFCNNCGGSGGNWDSSPTYSYTAGVYGRKTYVYPEGYKRSEFEHPLLKANDTFPFYPVGTDLSIGALKSSFIYSKNERNTPNELLSANTNYYFNTDSPYLPDSPEFSHPVLDNPNYPKSLKVDYKVRLIDHSRIQAPFTVHDFFYFKIYKDYDVEKYINRTTTTEHFNGQVVEKNAVIEYDTHYQQNQVTTSDSNNNTIVNEMYYPYDFTDAVSQEMVVKNCIAPIVKVVNKKNGDILNSFKYDFASMGYSLFKPSAFLTSKGNDALEKVKEYGYDFKGNVNYIRDYATATPPRVPHNDPTIIIIWGYNQAYPIAKIENGASGLPPSQIADLQAISDTRPEAELIAALDALRVTFPNAMVTTYTYKPLVGISTMTDPKGNRMTYVYDSSNRLKEVRDKDNKILSENQYHYQTQN